LQRRGKFLAILSLLLQHLRQAFGGGTLIGGSLGDLTANFSGGLRGGITALGRFLEFFRQRLGDLLLELIGCGMSTRYQFSRRRRSFRSVRRFAVLRLLTSLRLLTGLRRLLLGVLGLLTGLW